MLAVSLALVFMLMPGWPSAFSSEDADAEHTLEATTGSGAYAAEVTYGRDAQIPDGAKLVISELGEDSDEYAAAREALAADDAGAGDADAGADAGADALGFAALDLHLEDDGGEEVEPAEGAKVSVELTASDLPENVAADSIQVAHVKDGAAQTVAASGEESAGSVSLAGTTATASFETESFSTFAITYALKAAKASTHDCTVEVGSTITIDASSDLTGTPSGGTTNTWSWSSSSESVATASGSSSTGTVTGVAAGTATITVTHTYSKNKNKTDTESKTYTVTVTAASSSTTVSEDDATAQSGSASGVTVSVKENGNAKKISGYHVVVENANSDWSSEISSGSVLQAYHIYLADSSGNKVSASDLMNGTLNLKVTLTYTTLPTWWDSATGVKHFTSHADQSTQFINNVSFDKTNKQISFIVHGFSDFTITANGSSSGTTTGGTTVTAQTGSILNGVEINDANEWQIVSGEYTNNLSTNKTVSDDGNVRVQKNVIPTGTENEFYVYLSIDTKDVSQVTSERVAQYLRSTTFSYVDSSNTWQTGSEGDYWTGTSISHGNSTKTVSYNPNGSLKAGSTADITFTYGGVTIGTFRMTTEMSNGTWYLPIHNDSGSIVGFVNMFSFKGRTSGTVKLSEVAYTYLIKEIWDTYKQTTATTLNSVSDTLGSNIELINVVGGDYSSVSTTNTSGVLTWNISKKSSPQTESSERTTTTNSAGTLITTSETTWNLNVAELLYKVKYTPTTSAGLDSSTNAPQTISDPTAADNTATGEADVNQSATLSYKLSSASSNSTKTFPVPEVRGMLYEIDVAKTDAGDGGALQGAQFTLYSDADCTQQVGDTVTSGTDGKAKFTGLQTGTYYVKETKAPDGYKIDDATAKGPFTVSYTTAASSLAGQGIGKYALYKTSSGSTTNTIAHTFTDSPIVVFLLKCAVGSDGRTADTSTPLANATFTLYTDSTYSTVAKLADGTNNATATTDGNGQLSWSKLPAGTYYLKETHAPAGYQLASDTYTLVVSDTPGVGGVENNLITVNGEAPSTANTITIADAPNPTLPTTSGLGMVWLLLAGAGLATAGTTVITVSAARRRRMG